MFAMRFMRVARLRVLLFRNVNVPAETISIAVSNACPNSHTNPNTIPESVSNSYSNPNTIPITNSNACPNSIPNSHANPNAISITKPTSPCTVVQC